MNNDLKRLINVSFNGTLTEVDLGASVDIFTDLAVYARQHHISGFSLHWRPFQNSYVVTKVSTVQCSINQSQAMVDNFHAEVAKLKLPTDWSAGTPEKILIYFDYLEMSFIGVGIVDIDEMRKHLQFIPPALKAKQIEQIEFAWDPISGSHALHYTRAQKGLRTMRNDFAIVRNILADLKPYVHWSDPHAVDVSIVGDAIEIKTSNSLANLVPIGWLVTDPALDEETLRKYLELHQNLLLFPILKHIHQTLKKLMRKLGDYRINIVKTNHVWIITADWRGPMQCEIKYMFSLDSLGRTYPIEFPCDLPESIETLFDKTTNGYITIIDYGVYHVKN